MHSFFSGETSYQERQSTPPAPAVPPRSDLEPVKVRAGLAAELLELLRIK